MRKTRNIRIFAVVAFVLVVLISSLLFGGALMGRDAQPSLSAATTTPTPTPVSTPPPIPAPTPIDISGSISGSGTVQQDIMYSVLAGQAVLNIAEGTSALTVTGGPLQSITTAEECYSIPAAPLGAYIIGCAYDYMPNGATFNPAATLTLKYDPGLVPPGVDASKLVIAYYDTATSKWVVAPSVADTVNHVVTAQVSHFSLFVVYGTTATPVTGITREVNGAILSGVSLTTDGTGTVVSNQSGQYETMATSTGSRTIVAHKDGFRDRTQTVNVAGLGSGFAVISNFQGQYGLISNAPDMLYALNCINHWLYPPSPDTGLTMLTALSVINAWLYPIH